MHVRGATTEQLRLPLPKRAWGWGGARPGAGRKKKPGTVPHARRPFHDRTHPVHVTVRAARGVGLRRLRVAEVILRRLRDVATAPRFAARRRTFRVVHFSVQDDHLHLVVEATSARALSRGLQGLLCQLARRVNRRLGRRGKLFTQRFHARALATPREVRSAVVYVLTTAAKHGPHGDPRARVVNGIDPLSSARWFDGWARPAARCPLAAPVATPRTWLLHVGWRRHGLVARTERPAEPQPPPRPHGSRG